MSQPEPSAARTAVRVLVVDDAATVRAYTRSVLTADGFAVEEAVNGMEGLERALAQPPDLLIVDINMQKMDGYAMLRRLRREPSLAAVPAVMISTEEKPADRERALEAGANWYFVKPVRPDDLVAAARLLTGRPLDGGAEARP
ncbi:response regulator [Azospirillum sp. RWY-5-1]|uniref:Response regulator n=1 Tax=Azospirillum oleiclasticum TaxID=2735135 RepID=A0ABX2TJA8_9PROT|nr:response regulator [Azospirillum oleiclasticum]NYZ16832.1 response regulator [Azospirillum oleiclasticum]NYZ24435.1 response regulator [Azospirillum oleiclasticum]